MSKLQARGFNQVSTPGRTPPEKQAALKKASDSGIVYNIQILRNYNFSQSPCARVGAYHLLYPRTESRFLRAPDLRSEMHAYLTATMRGLACEPVRVGGVGDHVHILTALSGGISLAELVSAPIFFASWKNVD